MSVHRTEKGRGSLADGSVATERVPARPEGRRGRAPRPCGSKDDQIDFPRCRSYEGTRGVTRLGPGHGHRGRWFGVDKKLDVRPSGTQTAMAARTRPDVPARGLGELHGLGFFELRGSDRGVTLVGTEATDVANVSGRRVLVGPVPGPSRILEVFRAELDAGEDGGRHPSASALAAARIRATDGLLNST